MNILETLKSLIEHVFKIKIGDISILSNIQIHYKKDSNNKAREPVTIDNRQVHIHLHNVDQNDLPQVRTVIKEAFKIEGTNLLETQARGLFQKLCDFYKKPKSADILKFFEKKIPPDDFNILKSALFIAEEMHDKKSIELHKSEVVAQYGRRASRIINLCTSGYYDTFFRPMYDFSRSQIEFLAHYNRIVEDEALSLFVHKSMNVEAEIRKKITVNRRYGIKNLFIHGRGGGNRESIRRAIRTLESEGIPLTIRNQIYIKSEGIMIMDILLD